MKAEELRIGNWAYTSTRNIPIRFTSFFGLCNVESHPDDFNPIPLTEEWLLKFGFEKGNAIYHEGYSLVVLETDFYLRPCYIGGYYWGFNLENKNDCELYAAKNICHVHQLQNLYYALTEEELTIK